MRRSPQYVSTASTSASSSSSARRPLFCAPPKSQMATPPGPAQVDAVVRDQRGELLRRACSVEQVAQQAPAQAPRGDDLVAALEQVERDQALEERQRRVDELGARGVRRRRDDEPFHLAVEHDLAAEVPRVAHLDDAERTRVRELGPRLPHLARAARGVGDARAGDHAADAVEQQHRHADERRHLGQQLVRARLRDQQVEQVVLQGDRAAQTMQVRGGQHVVDVREDVARERARGKRQDRQLELLRARHHLLRDLVQEVPQRDHQRRGVDAREAVQDPHAHGGILVPGAPRVDEHALAREVRHRVVGVREVDALDDPAQTDVAGHGRQPEAGVVQQLTHREDARRRSSQARSRRHPVLRHGVQVPTSTQKECASGCHHHVRVGGYSTTAGIER